jgi:hypothetical protein
LVGEDLPYVLHVSIPLGRTAVASRYVPDCNILVGREVLEEDQIIMAIKDYDLILGMDWLSKYEARVDYRKKTVQFVKPGRHMLEFKNNQVKEKKFLIARPMTWKMLTKGYQGYSAYLLNEPKDQCTLEDTIVVKEFHDVFSAELTSLPPSREVEFTIDLVPGAKPVSRTPHWMALTELKELKELKE